MATQPCRHSPQTESCAVVGFRGGDDQLFCGIVYQVETIGIQGLADNKAVLIGYEGVRVESLQ